MTEVLDTLGDCVRDSVDRGAGLSNNHDNCPFEPAHAISRRAHGARSLTGSGRYHRLNLLNRAKRLLQGQGPSVSHKTQYYNVLCPDGHRMSGARNEGYQALRCPSCGEGVFILPRSPLPEVSAPPRPAARPERRSVSEVVEPDEPIALNDPPPMPPREATEDLAEIEWEEDTPSPPAAEPDQVETVEPPRAPKGRPRPSDEEPPPPSTKRPASPAPNKGRTRPAPQPVRVSPRERAAPEIPEAPAFSLQDWVRRRRNPLIFTGVALLVVGTIGLRQWRSQLQDFPRQAEIGRTEGLQALDEGQWDKAHQLLARAKRAVDALGGKVEGAEDIRHGADEAALYANLISETLEDLLKQADPDDTSAWPREFATYYKGRAVVVQAEVTAVPGEGQASEYDLDYRILPNGEGDLGRRRDLRIGRFDLSRFKLIHDLKPKKGTQLAFGARLASFTFDPERGEWLIGLEPDSGVILLHPKALNAALLIADSESPPEEGKR